MKHPKVNVRTESSTFLAAQINIHPFLTDDEVDLFISRILPLADEIAKPKVDLSPKIQEYQAIINSREFAHTVVEVFTLPSRQLKLKDAIGKTSAD